MIADSPSLIGTVARGTGSPGRTGARFSHVLRSVLGSARVETPGPRILTGPRQAQPGGPGDCRSRACPGIILISR